MARVDSNISEDVREEETEIYTRGSENHCSQKDGWNLEKFTNFWKLNFVTRKFRDSREFKKFQNISGNLKNF